MKLNDIRCKKCNRLLAIPKFKETPAVYRNHTFELYGDKRKLYTPTKNSIWKPNKVDSLCKYWLVDLKCKHCD